MAVGASPTNIQFGIQMDGAGDGSATSNNLTYVSQPMLVFGSSIGEGNYTRPQGEYVAFETAVSSNLLNSYTGLSDSGVATLNIEADSNGAIPKGAKSFKYYVRLKDSGSAGTDHIGLQLMSSGIYRNYNIVSGLANDTIGYWGDQTCECTADGDFGWTVNASGSGTLDLTGFQYDGVTLR